MSYSDQDSTELKPKDKTELLRKLDNYFRSSLDHPTWKAWRDNALTCFKYKEGDQWTAAEKAELEKRGQPATVNNQVSVTIERMVGQFVKQKVRIGYRGRNPQDKPLADVLSDLFLFIRQNNGLEFEERDMADDGFTGGFGVLETYVTFNDNFEPEICIRHEDAFNIFPDPFSKRYNWNEDGTFICRAKWVDIEEAKELYPKYAAEIDGIVSNEVATLSGDQASTSAVDAFKNENYIDVKKRRIRLVECQYKVKEKESICLFQDGTVLDNEKLTVIEPDGKKQQITKDQAEKLKAGGARYREIERINNKIKIGVFSAHLLFSHKDAEVKNFSFIPYFLHRKKSGEPYSLVSLGLSMQDGINKRESKSIHLLNNNRTFAETGAITDKSAWANEIARPDGVLEVNRGFFEKFKVDEHLDIGKIHFDMHNAGKNDYRQIVGINPDALGEPSEVRSGVGIARKQQMTDVIIAPVFDNMRRTRKILAANVLELVQTYYTEKKIFYITDDLGAAKQIEFDPTSQGAIKQATYDIVVDDLPDTTTMQQEQFQMLSQILPEFAKYGPAYMQLAIQMSEIPHKEDLIKQVAQMSQPAPDKPKINLSLDWSKLVGPEKAAFAQEMGLPELAQFEMQNPLPPEHVVKAQTDVALEQGKTQAENQRTQADLAKVAMGAQHDQEKHRMQMQHEQQKHEMDMQKAKVDIAHTIIKGAAAKNGEPRRE